MISMPIDTLPIALNWLKAHPSHYLFPIQRLEKSPPLFADYLALASNDPQVITQWYRTGTVRTADNRQIRINAAGCDWGISLAKSHLVVIDIDDKPATATKPAKKGSKTLAALIEEHGELPETLVVRTTTGGKHLYYNEANGVVHGFAVGVNGFGEDIDSPNYVMVPGTWLSSSNNKYYEITNNKPIADTPEWFGLYLKGSAEKVSQEPVIDELDTDALVKRAIQHLQTCPPSIQGRGGDQTMLMTGVWLKDNGISLPKAKELVREYYNDRCVPPWEYGDCAIGDSADAKLENSYGYLHNMAPGEATTDYRLSDDREYMGFGTFDANGKFDGDLEAYKEAKLARIEPEQAEKLRRSNLDWWTPVANLSEPEGHVHPRNIMWREPQYSDTVAQARMEWEADKGAYFEKHASPEAKAAKEEGKRKLKEAKAKAKEKPEPPKDPQPPKPSGPKPDLFDDGAAPASDSAEEAFGGPDTRTREEKAASKARTDANFAATAVWNASFANTLTQLSQRPDRQPLEAVEVGEKYVWIVAQKRFVKRTDPSLLLDEKQFESKFKYIAKKGSICTELFANRTTLRRFDHLAFRPDGPEFNEAKSEYNSWRAWGLEPKEASTKAAEVGLKAWNDHIRYLFPDHEQRQILLNWCAWILQNGGKKPKHGMIIVGVDTGTGKSLIARILEQIVGEKNTKRPKNTSMGGEFNSWLANCRLCVIEEMYQTGQWERMNALRDIVTEPTVEINIKGIPAYQIPNYVCFLAVSNHPDAAPLRDNDRRWQVLSTEAKARDFDSYQSLYDMLPEDSNTPIVNPEGLRAVAWELMHRDLTMYEDEERTRPMYKTDSTGKPVMEEDELGFLVPKIKVFTGAGHPEPTAARAEMIELSRSEPEGWLYEAMNDAPFSGGLVTVEDIMSAMGEENSASSMKQARTSTRLIPTFLKSHLKGKKLQRKENGKMVERRIRLLGKQHTVWHLNDARFDVTRGNVVYRNQHPNDMTNDEIIAVYEALKNGSAKANMKAKANDVNNADDQAF